MHRPSHFRPLLAVALAVVALLCAGCDRTEVRKAIPVLQERAEKLASGEAPLIALPTDRPAPSEYGQELILEFEVGGGRAYYDKFLRRPSNGGGVASGVTVGIGYDLRFNSPARIREDWGPHLSRAQVERLAALSGKKQTPELVASVRDIEIPWPAALAVYERTTIPRFWSLTKATWPGVENLTPDGQWPALSLIFNRGTSLSGSRRREMANLKVLIPRKDYPGMARETRSMKRLWPDVRGLLRRREAEADLWDYCWQAYGLTQRAGRVEGFRGDFPSDASRPLRDVITWSRPERRWTVYPVVTATANEAARYGYDLTAEIRGTVLIP